MKTLMKTLALAAILLPAHGQAQEAARWQGFYLGAQGLFAHGSYTAGHTPDALDTRGAAPGLFGGYGWTLGSSGVVAAEINAQIGSAGEGTSPGYPWLEDMVSLRLRAGVVRRGALFYAGIAAARADLELKGRTYGVSGPMVFLGAEVPVSRSVTARIEYGVTRMQLPGGHIFGPDQFVTTGTVSMALSYRF